MVTGEIEGSSVDAIQAIILRDQDSLIYCFDDYYKEINNPKSKAPETGFKYLYYLLNKGFEGATSVIEQSHSTTFPVIVNSFSSACRLFPIMASLEPFSYSNPDLVDTSSSSNPSIDASELKAKQLFEHFLYRFQNEDFDSDVEYDFSMSLSTFIKDTGKSVINTFKKIVEQQVFPENLFAETLKAFGRIEDENTKDERYQILIYFAKNRAALLRDAAVSGLSYLDDVRALPQLRILLEAEPSSMLRKIIYSAIRGLEKAR
jgi:hypothetical protein